MLAKRISVVPVKIKAVTLIETLLALFLGSMILLGVSYFYSESYKAQNSQKELLQLQKEAHQLINYFQQHIQHIGYQGLNRENSNFHLFEQANKRLNLSEKCLIFFYDLNSDGCLGKRTTKTASCVNGNLNNSKDLAKEIFGFKLENKEIYFYANNKLENCLDGQCQQLLLSCNDKWTRFTSKEHFNVDELKFSWKKQNKIMQIDLTVSSIKFAKINYKLTAYIYILNGKIDNEDNKITSK